MIIFLCILLSSVLQCLNSQVGYLKKKYKLVLSLRKQDETGGFFFLHRRSCYVEVCVHHGLSIRWREAAWAANAITNNAVSLNYLLGSVKKSSLQRCLLINHWEIVFFKLIFHTVGLWFPWTSLCWLKWVL